MTSIEILLYTTLFSNVSVKINNKIIGGIICSEADEAAQRTTASNIHRESIIFRSEIAVAQEELDDQDLEVLLKWRSDPAEKKVEGEAILSEGNKLPSKWEQYTSPDGSCRMSITC